MTRGSSTTDSPANIFRGLGIATFLFLPAWGAMFSLRGPYMPWMGLADLIGTSVAVAVYFFWVTCQKGKLQLILVLPFVVLSILIGYDTVIYIYESLKAELRHIGVLTPIKDNILVVSSFCIFSSLIAIWFGRKHLYEAIKGIGTLFGILFILLVLQFSCAKIPFVEKTDNGHMTNVAQKIVILIFDELDADLLDAKLDQLPAFNHLEKNAALVGRVYSPSNYTHISVPSMLVGKPLRGIELFGQSIFVYPKGETIKEKLPSKDDLFSLAKDRGLRVSLIGWHLPYCAAFSMIERCIDDSQYGIPGNNITTIQWIYGKNSLLFKYRQSKNIQQFKDIDAYAENFFSDPRSFKSNNIHKLLNELEDRLKTDVAGNDFDLIFAHLPCPHLPRVDGQRTQGVFKDYDDNVIQCDRILGAVQSSLIAKKGQQWRLIVTSDHWFRVRDWITNMKPGDYPMSPRKVPFYFAENDFTGNPVRLSDGSNIRLAQIFMALTSPSPDAAKAIKEEVQQFGSESVFLDIF
jgi:hypothetical protein